MTGTVVKTLNGIEVTVRKVQGRTGTAVLSCEGYIDGYNSAEFTKAVEGVIGEGFKNLIFDVTKVNYVSNMMTFAWFLKDIKSRGGSLVITGVPPRALETFELLGYWQFFTFTETVEDALELFPEAQARADPLRRVE